MRLTRWLRATTTAYALLPTRHRREAANDADASVRSMAGPELFYAAQLATLRPSGRDDRACIDGVHAPFFEAAFLDRVTRDERDPVQFQFRPLDPATRVGVRTTRVEGAA